MLRPLALVLALTTAAGADPILIDDFADGPTPGWRMLTDQVMGGVSTGVARVEDGALRLSGTVSTANNGGFIQARLGLQAPLSPQVAALRLRVRGDGQRYFIHLRTTQTRLPWQYYQAPFDTSDAWQTIDLDLADFVASGRGLDATPAAHQIISIGLVAYGRDHEADVWLSRIEAR